MLFGPDKETAQKIKRQKLSDFYDLMIPHQVFVWWPRKVDSGQTAWLCKVWRVNYTMSSLEHVYFHYFLDQPTALSYSRRFNVNAGSSIYEEALKRLER